MNSPIQNNPDLGGSLEDWLESQVARHASWFKSRSAILDVGAYHGDFAWRFLQFPASPFATAALFEPNPDSFALLQKRFAQDKRFSLKPQGCSNQTGAATLHCQGAVYTGSILDYKQERDGPKANHSVSVTTVDEFLKSEPELRPGLIKVDTQGNDLRVLEGAVHTLKSIRPWVAVEMLTTPRFVHQATPVQMISFLEQQSYFLAALFNEFYTDTGWLAWCDACFVPQELFSMDVKTNHPRPARSGAASPAAVGWRAAVTRMLTPR